LFRTTYPDTTFEESSYDEEGRRKTSRDRAGRETSFEYDKLGRLKKTTYIDGTFTSTDYDEIGRVKSTTDARGHTTRYEYDPNCGCSGRRAKITDALGRVTQFTYDENGNQKTMTDALGHTMSYEYDALNRRVKTIYDDLTFEKTDYDEIGRNISRTDQAGKVTRFEYDELSRLKRVTDALNQETRYGYDELGNQLTQTDALSRVTRFEYDKLGRRIKRTLPLGQSETYGYNIVGNMISRTDFNGKTTIYGYDEMNRLRTKTPDPSLSQPTVSYTYTLTGRRETMTDASGVTSYGYDNRDRLRSKATPQGTLTYSYDAAGNLETMNSSNTNGVSVTYGYDELNRLSTTTDNGKDTRPGTGSTGYSYDEVGNLSGYLYPNGVQTNYSYNTLNRLTSMSVSRTGTTLSSYVYTLGAAGNRESVTEANGRKAVYTYDDLYRLKSETISLDPVTANNGAINYDYDRVGNRLSRTSSIAAVPTTAHTFDNNDRLTSDGYDSNGNTIASSSNTYSFDFENRLTSMNNGQVQIVYDGDGNRVAKTVGGVTTRYLVDDLNPTGYAQVVEELAVVSGQSSVVRAYVYGNDLISQQQMIGGWAASFYGYDGHGSVRMLTDANGVVTDTYNYDAFGLLIHQTGSTQNDYLYAGEQRDAHLGLDYLRARYMNPATGRFWSIDEFEGLRNDPQSLHKFLYANNNPVNRNDPSGYTSLVEAGIASITRGIITGISVSTVIGVASAVATLGFLPKDAFLKPSDGTVIGLQSGFSLGQIARWFPKNPFLVGLSIGLQFASTVFGADLLIPKGRDESWLYFYAGVSAGIQGGQGQDGHLGGNNSPFKLGGVSFPTFYIGETYNTKEKKDYEGPFFCISASIRGISLLPLLTRIPSRPDISICSAPPKENGQPGAYAYTVGLVRPGGTKLQSGFTWYLPGIPLPRP
jgi:RHS repeat-associated protein